MLWGIFPAKREAPAAAGASLFILLFHGDGFGKVAGLINVAAALERDVVREELERHDAERGQQHRGRIGNGAAFLERLVRIQKLTNGWRE